MDHTDPTTPSSSSSKNEAGSPGPESTRSPASSETKATSGKSDSMPPSKESMPRVTVLVEPNGNLRIEMMNVASRDQATQMLMAAWFETLRESITQDVMVGMMQQAQMANAMQGGRLEHRGPQKGGIIAP